jgi:hypothetical protein
MEDVKAEHTRGRGMWRPVACACMEVEKMIKIHSHKHLKKKIQRKLRLEAKNERPAGEDAAVGR